MFKNTWVQNNLNKTMTFLLLKDLLSQTTSVQTQGFQFEES